MATRTETATATQASPGSTLTLEPPGALQTGQPEQEAGLVPLREEQKDALEERVDTFVSERVALDSNSPEFGKKVDQLTTMGRKEIAEAAGHSNRFLDRPVKAINADTGIGADLTELRRTVEELDPAQGNLSRPRRLFGFIPFGNRMRGYFMKYQSAQTHIAKILAALASGKDELLQDNAAIDTERAQMWKTMGKLEQMIHISKTLDAKLEDKANELDA